MPSKNTASTERVPDAPDYRLHLFVTGASPRSLKAVAGLKTVCEEFLPGRYELVVTDIYQQPEQAREYELIAAPTLIRLKPLPVRRLVGDLSDRPRVLDALGVPGRKAR